MKEILDNSNANQNDEKTCPAQSGCAKGSQGTRCSQTGRGRQNRQTG